MQKKSFIYLLREKKIRRINCVWFILCGDLHLLCGRRKSFLLLFIDRDWSRNFLGWDFE